MPLHIPDSITSPLKEELEAIFEGKITEYIDRVLLHKSMSLAQRSRNLFEFISYLAENTVEFAEFLSADTLMAFITSTKKEADTSQICTYVPGQAVDNYARIFGTSIADAASICQERAKYTLLSSARATFIETSLDIVGWWSPSIYSEVVRVISKSISEIGVGNINSLLYDAKRSLSYMLAHSLKERFYALQAEDVNRFKDFLGVVAVAAPGGSLPDMGCGDKLDVLPSRELEERERVVLSVGVGAGGDSYFFTPMLLESSVRLPLPHGVIREKEAALLSMADLGSGEDMEDGVLGVGGFSPVTKIKL